MPNEIMKKKKNIHFEFLLTDAMNFTQSHSRIACKCIEALLSQTLLLI